MGAVAMAIDSKLRAQFAGIRKRQGLAGIVNKKIEWVDRFDVARELDRHLQ